MSAAASSDKDNNENNKRIVLENIFSFPGGVFPEENKAQTTDKGIIEAELPKELIVPLQQHIGAAAKVCVAVGDNVLKGQLIAQASGFVSVNIHAPSSGTVTAIEERKVQHPSGLAGICVIIATDGKDQWTALNTCEDYASLEQAELIQKIQTAGIAGMGGAGFPSSVKLSVKDKKINTLILNSAECEPYITADDVLIQEQADKVLLGLDILNYIIEAKEVLIGIEDNKPVAIEAYKRAIDNTELKHIDSLKLAIVPTKYPSGGEKQLIQLLTGKEVPVKGLPADLGIVCHNTGTVIAIYEAIILGKPLISRVTTLTGNALNKPQNYRALIGTPFRSLLEQADINWKQLGQLVMGGPMMGFAVHSPDVPLVKTTNCILASAPGELSSPELEQPCIRCGSCAEVCPVNLLPQQLYWYSKTKELEKTEEYHLNDCIECGACSFVCPSNIPLVQYFRFGKGETRKKAIELEKSEQSRERFEARKARIEREEAEKEAKRIEKAEARKLKKAQQAEQQADNSKQETLSTDTEKLEIAFQLAKTNSAKATKQWKDAEKALIAAKKSTDKKISAEEVSTLEQQVLSLETASQEAQLSFKTALANKKAVAKQANGNVSDNSATSSASKQLEAELEDAREESTLAAQALKALKKNLISAKSGNADTSEIEAQVAIAKDKSDQLKTKLRDLLKKQKELVAPAQESEKNSNMEQTAKDQDKILNSTQDSTQDNSEKDQLKITMAQIKAESKKLQKDRLDAADDETKEKLDVLIKDNKKQLNHIVEKMTALNTSSTKEQEL